MRTQRFYTPLLIFLLTVLTGCLTANAHSTQKDVQLFGVVKDGFTGKPLQAVSVFLNNTYIGTATDMSGQYRLSYVPAGTYTLVFSRVGYTRKAFEVQFPLNQSRLQVELYPVVINLGEVDVNSEADREWKENYRIFSSYFMGHTRNARESEIVNPEVLEFIKTDSRFHAWSAEPLIIKNLGLGYRIEYHLESMLLYDKIMLTNGFASYRELNSNSRDTLSFWEEERFRAYRGSYRHFLNALIANTIYEDGFRIYFSDQKVSEFNSELRKPKLVPVENPAEIFRYNKNLQRIELINESDHDYLRVDYVPESPEAELVFAFADFSAESHQISWIEIPNGKVLVEFKTGYEVSGYRSLLHGYWAWSSRLPELLPKEYRFNNRALSKR